MAPGVIFTTFHFLLSTNHKVTNHKVTKSDCQIIRMLQDQIVTKTQSQSQSHSLKVTVTKLQSQSHSRKVTVTKSQ
jgi:hypothetical protein